MDIDLRASGAREAPFSHVSARAVEAVCLLMTNALNLETLMGVIPSAWMTAPFAMRARMNEVASFSVIETAGSALPPRPANSCDNLATDGSVPAKDGHGNIRRRGDGAATCANFSKMSKMEQSAR
jgi:hypothetical protein